MTLLSVLIVFALEYHFRWGAEYRKFDWFEKLRDRLAHQFAESTFFEGGGGVLLVVGLPVAVLGVVLSMLGGPLQDLLLLVISVAALFYCMGPEALETSLEPYFEAMGRNDTQAAYLVLQQQTPVEDIPESDEFVRNATRSILVEGHTRYFGVTFWFIFLGPCGALGYRLIHQYLNMTTEQNPTHHDLVKQALHWIEWVPARLTCLLFLLAGDFVNGFYRVKDYLFDIHASNYQLISETGIAALGLKIGRSDGDFSENREAVSMVIRTAIIYLVAAASVYLVTVISLF